MKLSIISPVYEAENIVDTLCKRIIEQIEKITSEFEIILVEDGSRDQSWQSIVRNCKLDKRIKGVKLSRNFGQHYAVTAGVKKAKGDFIILMDCDLQDDPKDIFILYSEFLKGNEVIFTKRENRKQSLFKGLLGKFYHSVFNIFSDRQYDVDAGSLVGFGKKAQKAFNKFPDKDRLYIQILKWVGFQSTYVTLEHKPRFEGKSSYDFHKVIIIAVQGLISHSTKILNLNIWVGLIFFTVSFLSGLYEAHLYFMNNHKLGSTIIILAIFFSTGIILISTGITGLYIGKTFEQSKNRQLYIIQKEIN